MINNFKPAILFLLLLFCWQHSNAQFNPADIPDHSFFRGYVKSISGESIGYHSFHPYATDALLTRVTDGNKAIEWETEAIPNNNPNEIFFSWIAGYSSGTSAADRHFDLFINHEKVLSFTTKAKQVVKSWEEKGLHGVELYFQQKSVDNVMDVYGNMYLKIPAGFYKEGEPLLLKVVGEKAGSQDWYMTFKYEMSEKINIIAQPALIKIGKDTMQLIDVQIDHTRPTGNVFISTSAHKTAVAQPLILGVNTIEIWVPKVNKEKNIEVSVVVGDLLSKRDTIPLQPVIYREFDFISHSHNDIGYSDLQDSVEKKQTQNIRDAMAFIQRNNDYPDAAKHKWNIESLWAVENFIRVATDEEKKKFVQAVKAGSIGLPASYVNVLTGLCTPEDLIHYTEYALKLHREYGMDFNTVMISDIPGVSWAMVPALAERGIKYISSGPNYVPSIPDLGDRVGHSDKAWGDKPFYWLSASGKEKVLFWQASKGYSWFHNYNVGHVGEKTKSNLMDYLKELEANNYPYDIVQLRYSIPADNGTPDPRLSEFVKNWNEKFISPKIVVANVSEMMVKFEKKYANIIPVISGDYSPYWEDGAVSSAKELAMARRSSEQLNQAEILASIKGKKYDVEKFYAANRDVIMFKEHTWGSWNSVSDPDNSFTLSQWDYKRDFALNAAKRSEKLLNDLLDDKSNTSNRAFDLFNTSSFDRSDLVIIPGKMSRNANAVIDENKIASPAQRLSDGSLLFLAKDVPALSAKKYALATKEFPVNTSLKITKDAMENEFVKIRINQSNGSISSIICKDNNEELVDNKIFGINQYVYVPGRDPAKAQSAENVSIRVKENGPLMISLEIKSVAPGTSQLIQEIRLYKSINKIDLINTLDKTKVREKEAVNFAFPFLIPGGKMKIDLGVGILEPGINQLAGSNNDFNCVQRWVDISNNKSGITWTTVDAPLIEIGEMINEEEINNGYKKWKSKTTLSNTFFSYVMNNYWHTNYKADQDSGVVFHYAIFPHHAFDAAMASRHGLETNQPLLIAPAGMGSPAMGSLFSIGNKNIVLSSLKPSADKKGMIMRLYNAGDQSQLPAIEWRRLHPRKIYWSNANEEKIKLYNQDESWPAFSFRSLYLEL